MNLASVATVLDMVPIYQVGGHEAERDEDSSFGVSDIFVGPNADNGFVLQLSTERVLFVLRRPRGMRRTLRSRDGSEGLVKSRGGAGRTAKVEKEKSRANGSRPCVILAPVGHGRRHRIYGFVAGRRRKQEAQTGASGSCFLGSVVQPRSGRSVSSSRGASGPFIIYCTVYAVNWRATLRPRCRAD